MGTRVSDALAAVPVFHSTLHFNSVPETSCRLVVADMVLVGYWV